MIQYPKTRKDSQIDEYFGHQVADPYRWLEVDTDPEVTEWVEAQNKETFAYLNQIPFRDKIRSRLAELFNYTRIYSPFKAGDYYFFYQNDGLQNQAVLYRQKGLDGKAEIFLDPNQYSEEGTTSMDVIGLSKDDRYLTISISEAGSDWQSFKIMEVESGQELEDELKWIKFSGASWYKDGFFYSRYPQPESGTEFSGDLEGQAVYYHKIGDPQENDQLIYEDPQEPKQIYGLSVTEDQQFLLLYKYQGASSENELYYRAIDSDRPFQPLFQGFKHQYECIDHWNGRFYIRTNQDAPRYQLISVPVAPAPITPFQSIIAEKKEVLNAVSKAGGKFFANYMKDVATKIYQYDYAGTEEREINLPGLGTALISGTRRNESHLFYVFTSFIYPSTIFRYQISTGHSTVFFQPKLQFEPRDFKTQQVFYKSKDGTDVPMFLVHKKGLIKDGKRPVLLTAYGGFNVNLQPAFNPLVIALLEKGCILAQPNIRGGGEYGAAWHEAGMRDLKQNVFDDFMAAARYLIKEGYSQAKYLAISGGSNGGLLVGAVMNQAPELFRVAFPAVGVMDMLRYHKFTIGWAWVPEYGSSEESEASFQNLIRYSPLHNLSSDNKYPSTLITTADHDDRVVPAHSFKFAARLQEVYQGPNPVLIRIEVNAGHGAGKPTGKILDEYADKYAFMLFEMGLE